MFKVPEPVLLPCINNVLMSVTPAPTLLVVMREPALSRRLLAALLVSVAPFVVMSV